MNITNANNVSCYPAVNAVIVTYNRKELLINCINAVLNQTYPIKAIVIVDNASTDGTDVLLKELGYLENKQILYQHLATNIGGAGGFHEGMKLAHKLSQDWCWIMDDDVIPSLDCLQKLFDASKVIKENISFLASAVRNSEGAAMNVPKIDRRQFAKYTDWYQYLDEGIVKIVKATFVSLLINDKAIQKCGLPWAPFFIWGDDSEYTQRIIRDYGPAFMVGKSKAIHLRSSADELSIVKETNALRIPLYYYLYRNNLIGFFEYETAFYKFLCLGKLGWDALNVIAHGKYKIKKIIVIIKAFNDFIFGKYDKNSFSQRAKIK